MTTDWPATPIWVQVWATTFSTSDHSANPKNNVRSASPQKKYKTSVPYNPYKNFTKSLFCFFLAKNEGSELIYRNDSLNLPRRDFRNSGAHKFLWYHVASPWLCPNECCFTPTGFGFDVGPVKNLHPLTADRWSADWLVFVSSRNP